MLWETVPCRRSCVGKASLSEFDACPWSLIFAGTGAAQTSTGLQICNVYCVLCLLDLHLDGTQHDPDVVGPQLDVDDANETLTTREYVSFCSVFYFALCRYCTNKTEFLFIKVGNKIFYVKNVNVKVSTFV